MDKSYKKLRTKEKLDFEIFRQFLSPHYATGDNVSVMCVGVQSGIEDKVVRAFHDEIGVDSVKVAACNVKTLPSFNKIMGSSYDFERYNWKEGDALNDAVYDAALEQFKSDKFNLVYIRCPDVSQVFILPDMFAKALEKTSTAGAVIATFFGGDKEYCEPFLEVMKERYGIEPVLFKETGIKQKGVDDKFNPHHYVAVFKPNSD